jgi:hypothetical protein
MYTITGGGSFTRQNITQINSNFSELAGGGGVSAGSSEVDVWVRPQVGNNNTADGSYTKPYATLAGVSRVITAGIVIGVEGVIKEEFSSPIINDVTIVGAKSNQPRQATTSGVANGGGATWLSPSGGTASLLKINGQAWKVQNIYFNNSATGASTAGVEIVGGGDPPLTADGGHTQILNCVFTGEANGIYINGGPGFLTIAGNTFYFFDTSGDIAIKAGGSGGTGYGSKILNNVFAANLTHISVGATAYGWEIAGNRFSYIDAGVTTTTQVSLSTGNNNSVHDNYFDLPYSTNGITAMFTLGTNDRWYFNQFATAVTTTIYSFGAPAS